MKKLLSFAAAICVLVSSVSASAACNIKIKGNLSNPLCVTDSYIANGSTMVSFRNLCESLGAKVSWDAATNTASATCGGKTVSVCMGENQIETNSGTVSLPTPTCNKNGLTYVPLRSICEALGCNVNWNSNSGEINIVPTDNTCENGNYENQSEPTEPITPVEPETPSQSDSSYEQQVLELVNEQRANYGLAPLSYSKELEAVAYAHSKDMAQNNYFSHTNLSGQSPFDRIHAAGISYRSAAENIAAGQKTPQEVVNAWMNSAGHRANILNSSVTKMGVGIYSGGSYGTYWTQLFVG